MQKDTKRRRTLGAVLSAVFVGSLIAVITACMLADFFGSGGRGPETVVILLCAGLWLLMVAAIAAVCIQRLREIKRGEEDDAKKY